jgi:GNAT superfamily N-acetyltransferase
MHPPVELRIHKCPKSLWQVFRQYHYLSGSLSSASRCYAAYLNERPVAFIAIIQAHFAAHYWRVSRLVVLPDYQGIGIGKRLLNFVAELYTSQSRLPFYILTSNPQLARGNLGRWKIMRKGHASRMKCVGDFETKTSAKTLIHSNSRGRLSVSLKYIPERNTP